MPESTWTEKKLAEVKEAIDAMSHCDISYYDDFVWCGNENVEA